MDDPILQYSYGLLARECPNIDTSTTATIHSWIELFLDGALPYSDFRSRVLEQCGTANLADTLQDILTVSPEPLPEPRRKGICQSDLTGARNKTRPWSAQEDTRLLAAIRRFGLTGGPVWSTIAEFVGNGRSRSQCSQRWIRVLDPRISKAPWTAHEEQLLLDQVARHGEKAWMKVACELGSRSDVQCRYRYMQIQKEMLNGATDLMLPPLRKHLPAPPPARSWPTPPAVPKQELADSTPIPLASSLDVKKSDPLFDSNIWLWRMD
jgi:hypothetical protein